MYLTRFSYCQMFLFLLAGALSCSLPAQKKASCYDWSDLPEPLQQQIQDSILKVHELQQNTGLAVAVMYEGKLVYSRTFGWADVEKQLPVQRHT